MNLAGRRVLVTRPAGQQAPLLDRLQEAGAIPVCLPMLQIEPVPVQGDTAPAQALRESLQHLERFSRIIFVSTNAVQHALAALRQLGVVWPPALKAHAIGTATADALAAAGIVSRAPAAGAAMDSESLLALPELQAVAGERILIVRGVGGREHLAGVLAARGATVGYAEAYRRRCPQYGPAELAVLAPLPDAVLAASGETLQNLAGYLRRVSQQRWQDVPVVVPGARVAAVAREEGFRRVITASRAADAAMLEALQQDDPQEGLR